MFKNIEEFKDALYDFMFKDEETDEEDDKWFEDKVGAFFDKLEGGSGSDGNNTSSPRRRRSSNSGSNSGSGSPRRQRRQPAGAGNSGGGYGSSKWFGA